MAQSFANKVVLITGAGSGIGKVSAQHFAREGASLVIADWNSQSAENTASELKAQGTEAIAIKVDVSQDDQVQAMVDQTMDHYGALHVAINNAGIGGVPANTDAYPLDIWQKVIDVDLTGVFLCMKYQIPHLLKQGGSIVNVSSAAGLSGFAKHSAYAAAKHGVIGLTKSAAIEYARKGVRVNAICPAFTETPMVEGLREVNPKLGQALASTMPMGRLGNPEEIAQAILFLSSEANGFMTGVALPVDGGKAAM